jgi:hypothetical protein
MIVGIIDAVGGQQKIHICRQLTPDIPTDLGTTFERSESTKAWPTDPPGGASPVPRGNTTSISGHGSAAANGTDMDALNTAPAVTMAAQSRKANGRGRATPTVTRR